MMSCVCVYVCVCVCVCVHAPVVCVYNNLLQNGQAIETNRSYSINNTSY